MISSDPTAGSKILEDGTVATSEEGPDPRFGMQAPVLARIAINSGPVVVGDVGSGARQEQLALGETPNLAARLQDVAAPGGVVISKATRRLVESGMGPPSR